MPILFPSCFIYNSKKQKTGVMLKFLFARPSEISWDQKWLDVPEGAEVFTYHKKSAGRALLSGLILAAVAEAAAIHVLLSMWNYWVAWAATLTTAWFVLQVIAQIRAMGIRPMYVHSGNFRIRNGAFDLADVPISQIASIQRSTKEVKSEGDQFPPLNVGFPASHNVVITLTEPLKAKILNRKKRDFQTALLAIDDVDRLVDVIQKQMS